MITLNNNEYYFYDSKTKNAQIQKWETNILKDIPRWNNSSRSVPEWSTHWYYHNDDVPSYVLNLLK